MAIVPLNLSYTDKDYEALRERMFNLISGTFPDWTDEAVANFGNLLVDLFCHIGDTVLFYQDNQAKESRLTDALLRRNVLALAKMLGYSAATASAATADELFTLSAVPANDVTFPAGSIVRTRNVNGSLAFQLLLDLTIPAGTNPPQAFGTVEHSVSINDETFSATGLPNQEIKLAGSPFLDGSLVLGAGNGAYTVQPNFLSSTSSDRHVVVTVDANDRATVTFGNGVNGAIPSGSITADYKTGGGTAGNVEKNTINRIDGAFTDALGNPVTVSVNNPSKASGGANRETVAQVKQNAPFYAHITDRTVALEDYVAGAEEVSGVARALMATSDQVVGLPENRGRLYIVPVGGGAPSTALKNAVLTNVTVTRPKTVTFRVDVYDAVYLPVDVRATVYFTADADPETVVDLINDRLTEFFAIQNADGTKNENVLFGLEYLSGRSDSEVPEIPLSDIYNVVRDTPGVRKIGDRQSDFTLNTLHSDVAITHVQFPTLGTVVIVDGDTEEVVG